MKDLEASLVDRFPADSSELALALRLAGLMDAAESTADAVRAAAELGRLLARFPLEPEAPEADPLAQHLAAYGGGRHLRVPT